MKVISIKKTFLFAALLVTGIISSLFLYIEYFNSQDHADYLYSYYSPIQSSIVEQIANDEFGYVYSVRIRSKTLPDLRCYLRIPVHRQPYYRDRQLRTEFPGAAKYYERCLSLPLFPAMERQDVDRVVEALEVISKQTP